MTSPSRSTRPGKRRARRSSSRRRAVRLRARPTGRCRRRRRGRSRSTICARPTRSPRSHSPSRRSSKSPSRAPSSRLLVEDKSVAASPFLCTFAEGAGQCAKLPEKLATGHSGFRLLGSTDDDASPLVFLGQGGSEGIFRAQSGELVDRVVSFDAYSAKSGFVALVAAGNNDDGGTFAPAKITW